MHMQVILQENVPSLGFVGDVVRVRKGYARNFLFPQKLALPANDSNVALLEHQKKALEVKKAAKKGEAQELKKRLDACQISIAHLVSEGDRLFGSVSVAEIQAHLKEAGFEVDRSLFHIETPIRTLGEHRVAVRLHPEVIAQVQLAVTKKETAEA